MTPRERVRVALEHREPDRVPIDNNGFVAGMHEKAYKGLLRLLNMTDEIKVYDPMQGLAYVKDDILDLLGVDTRYLYAKPGSDYHFKINEDNTYEDEFGVRFKFVGNYAENIFPPLKGKSLEEIKKFKLPDPKDPVRFEDLEDRARYLLEKSNYSIWAGNGQNIFYNAWMLRGMEDFMIDTYSDKKVSKYIIDMIVDWVMEWYEGYMDKIGSYIDVFWFVDDWGTQSGPIISPDYFRKKVKPVLKKVVDFVKTKTEAKCCYHSCGSVYWCLKDLRDIGVDIIHPVQANAAENDTERIKREYGNILSFHGGTNNQGVFHRDIHTLAVDTLKRIKDLALGGGYIFSGGHNIQANMPPENILRFFEVAREYGKYPIDMDKIDKQIEIEKNKIRELSNL